MRLPVSLRVPALVAVGGLLAGALTGSFAGRALAEGRPHDGPTQPTAVAAPRVTIRYDAEHVAADLTAALAGARTYAFELWPDENAVPFTGSAAVRDGRSDLVARIDEDGVATELRLVGDDAYAHLPGVTDGFVRTSRTAPSDDLVGAYLGYLTSADVAALLAESRDAVVSVATGGPSEQLDQVPAQPFDVVVDLRRATGALHARFADGGTTNPYAMLRLWIGPDGLVRRYTEPTTGLRVDLTQWGADVDVTAPEQLADSAG